MKKYFESDFAGSIRSLLEKEEEWCDEISLIPSIQFPADWKIRIIPPFAGVCVRFYVELPNGTIKSVYLDTKDRLGAMGQPYWEVHQPSDKSLYEPQRCLIDEVDELLRLIAAQPPQRETL